MSSWKPIHPVLQYLRRVRATGSTAGVSDSELLRRFAATRDEAAFELLVWRHGAMVLRVCRGILSDSHDGEDAFQATFLALARKATAVAGLTAPAGWLYRVAYHIALKARRAKARRARHEAVSLLRHGPPSADSVIESAHLGALLHEEVNRLATRYRIPVVLCYFEGNTYEEVARKLGWPKGTVSWRLARARDLLKNRLMRRGVTFPAAGLVALFGATADAAVTEALAASTTRAATGYLVGGTTAVVASTAAVRLANGAIHTMFIAKMKAVALVCLTAGLVTAGASVLANGGGAGIPPEAVIAVAPPDSDASETPPSPAKRQEVEDLILAAQQRRESIQNLKQICLAMHEYHDVHSHFPGNMTDMQGKKLLSWRVAILPLLKENALYKQFHLDEPWNSPENKKLLSKMPKVFRMPNQSADATATFYQGFAGAETMFDPAGPVRMADVTDGTSNTIFVVEAGEAVPWTKPEDLAYHAAKPLPKLGGAFPQGFHAAFVDGSVRTLSKNFKESALRDAITRNGGEVLDSDALYEDRSHPGFNGRSAANSPAGFDLDQLKAEKAKLQETLQSIDAEVAKARVELTRLREQVAPDREAQIRAARLAAENALLADSVASKLGELQGIREQIENFKKFKKSLEK